jgi:Putative adhesin
VKTMTRSLMTGTLLALGSAVAGAQESTTWNWNGDLGNGRTVYLRNINGAVTFEAGTGNKVEVTAVKRWRRGDPADVRIEAKAIGDGSIIICALWTERATCDEDGYHGNNDRDRDRSWNRDNDVSVEFTVKVPANARVDASTVNGDLRVNGTSADIDASTVNGDLEAYSSAGRVEASTVNGSITVRTTATSRDDLDYSTVNGTVTVELPANSNLEVNLSTVNGRISSDFPLSLSGDINPRRIRARIGTGGPRLRASTVNGSIRLRKL